LCAVVRDDANLGHSYLIVDAKLTANERALQGRANERLCSASSSGLRK
jgi:hypothetical protein